MKKLIFILILFLFVITSLNKTDNTVLVMDETNDNTFYYLIFKDLNTKNLDVRLSNYEIKEVYFNETVNFYYYNTSALVDEYIKYLKTENKEVDETAKLNGIKIYMVKVYSNDYDIDILKRKYKNLIIKKEIY